MSFNGEIYNYPEIKQELEDKGWMFRTASDSEVLSRAYQEWGCDCFNKFNGMWAVAFYDSLNECLVLSRDRFGVKPLFYKCEDDMLVFASEMKVITGLIRENHINRSCVLKYLEKNILCNDETTLIDGIFEVPPGCTFISRNGKKESEKNIGISNQNWENTRRWKREIILTFFFVTVLNLECKAM